jgi:hypothetical protein
MRKISLLITILAAAMLLQVSVCLAADNKATTKDSIVYLNEDAYRELVAIVKRKASSEEFTLFTKRMEREGKAKFLFMGTKVWVLPDQPSDTFFSKTFCKVQLGDGSTWWARRVLIDNEENCRAGVQEAESP